VAAPAKPQYQPYEPTGSSRRSRYWRSGTGALNQGQTTAVVGFVWTHWMLDRGFEISYPDQFAQEIFAESQQVAGLEGDTGGFVWAAEHVLRERGLVEASYACTDIEAVIDALLEAGPLVAPLYLSGDLSPTRVEGRTIWRLPGDPVVGGHALLLNGIDLDLEIGDVRGFVRVKNSWGAEWGDGGQALISLDDLGRALQFDEVLLPIPEGDLPAQSDAAPGAYGPQSIGSDLWTIQDTVGYASYAEAIARGIQHAETAPPLTIGIKAPWGAGKTSLMRMIRQRLEGGEPRPMHLAGRARGEKVTNRLLLGRAQAVAGADLEATVDDDPAWRPTVWFNPWMYQTGEQVWAGLAHEIITQITERMPRVERERFWLELNVKRIDEQAVRRRIYALVLQRLVPWALGALVFIVAGLGLLAVNAVVAAVAIVGGPVGLAIAAAAQLRSVMSSRPSGELGQLIAPVSPDYAAQAGFFYLLQADLQRVLDLVATPRRPLVVFVDDLDRCAPGTVVQVIEAINLFLAGQYPNCIFVIAMEPDMVAAHVEAAYGTLAERFKGEFDLGWRFLEKIVQLPLTLPALEPDRATGFAESLFGGGETQVAAEPVTEEDANEAVRAAGATLAGAVGVAAAVAPDSKAADQVREEVARRLTIDEPEVKQAIAYAAPALHANPREIKRFVNVFRFLVMIHTERAIEGLATTASLDQLAKLALVSTRWPELMSRLAKPVDGDTTAFERLEMRGNADPPGFPADLTRVLRANPQVGPAARHYL
jgi:hypothetical protein